MRDYTIKTGDTSLSPVWAVVLSDAGVDLNANGWSVRAQARDREGDLVLDWARDGSIILGSAGLDLEGGPITTSTVRLYLPAEFTKTLTPRTLAYDVEIQNPDAGPLGDLLRYTIVDGASVRITADRAPNV